MERGEGLHPDQVVEDHGRVGIVGPIVELGHCPTERRTRHHKGLKFKITQLKYEIKSKYHFLPFNSQM